MTSIQSFEEPVGPRDRSSDGHFISVVIPTLGRPTIEETRKALAAQTRLPDEVLVVLDAERKGEAWARNEGFARSRGDIVAFTDDDCVPPPEWLARLVEAMDRHVAAGAGGTFLETDPLLASKRARRGFPRGEILDDENGWVGNTGNVAYRRAALERCREQYGNVFDPAMPVGVDMHLAWRVRRTAPLVYIPVAVTHLRRVTPLGYFRFQYARGAGIGRLHLARREAGPEGLPLQRSLLWPPRGRPRWGAAIWRKLLGPFDVSSFDSFGQFATYWVGEKCEAIGFARAILGARLGGGRSSPGDSP